MKRETLDKNFRRAMDYAADAVATLAIWHEISKAIRRKHFPHALDRFKPLFEYLPAMVFETAVLSLYKLLEEGPRPSVTRVISLAQQQGIIDRTERNTLIKRVNLVSPVWKKVRIIRHETVAHGNVEDIAASFQRVKLTEEELQTSTWVLVDVLNTVAKKLGVGHMDANTTARRYAANTLRLFRRLDR